MTKNIELIKKLNNMPIKELKETLNKMNATIEINDGVITNIILN